MNEAQDDPVLGLLTDIAEAVATLAARVDAMETAAAGHQVHVNNALVTIAEIATRTYYVSKPPDALPDDVIDANVMNAMIDRWPQEAVIGISRHDRQVLRELDRHPIETIDRLIECSKNHPDQSNANRLRMIFLLAMLECEKEKRAKARAQDISRDGLGRSR